MSHITAIWNCMHVYIIFNTKYTLRTSTRLIILSRPAISNTLDMRKDHRTVATRSYIEYY